jgi:hypothetical protein
MEVAIFILIWIVCGIASAVIASNRGASGCLWFGLGVLLGPIGLAASFVSGKGQRPCPFCRKNIHAEATKCPYCQSTMPAIVEHVQVTELQPQRELVLISTLNRAIRIVILALIVGFVIAYVIKKK